MDFELARRNMVASQVRTNEVTDPLVIDAIGEVPREKFLPAARQSLAYVDEDLEVATGRWLMEPMVAARLLQLADVQRTDHVLVLPCGTGYIAAVLAHMAGSIVAAEEDGPTKESAAKLLAELGADTVAVVSASVAEGCPGQAPYDVIVFDGAVSEIPEGIQQQLADGGRLVAVVQTGPVGRATLIQRTGDAFGRRTEFDASVPLLPEFSAKPAFVF
ncbi:MAG: protein-L-isoaspartate O-methyltransferase [Alphaproteobacteria bacterium]|nr:protein-L-isoaspartate O-methyltransferase [Alphaproteobacteria bacterium]